MKNYNRIMACRQSKYAEKCFQEGVIGIGKYGKLHAAFQRSNRLNRLGERIPPGHVLYGPPRSGSGIPRQRVVRKDPHETLCPRLLIRFERGVLGKLFHVRSSFAELDLIYLPEPPQLGAVDGETLLGGDLRKRLLPLLRGVGEEGIVCIED